MTSQRNSLLLEDTLIPQSHSRISLRWPTPHKEPDFPGGSKEPSFKAKPRSKPHTCRKGRPSFIRYKEPRDLVLIWRVGFPILHTPTFLLEWGKGQMPRKMRPALRYLGSWEKREHPFLVGAAIWVTPEQAIYLIVECSVLATGWFLAWMEKRPLNSFGGQTGWQ